MSQNKFLTVFGLFILLMVGSVYMFGVLSAEESSVNVSGTAYEDAYNSSMKTQEISTSLIPYLGLFLILVLIIIGVRMLRRKQR